MQLSLFFLGREVCAVPGTCFLCKPMWRSEGAEPWVYYLHSPYCNRTLPFALTQRIINDGKKSFAQQQAAQVKRTITVPTLTEHLAIARA